MKKFILLFSVLLSISLLSADTLVGRIIDKQTGKAIVGAAVTIDGTRLGTNSDESGKFSIPNLDAKMYGLKISRIGFESQQTQVDISKKQHVVVKMITKAITTDGFSVSATIAKKRETPVTFTNLTQADVISKNSGQEIPMLMDEVPGVYSYSESGGPIGNAQLKVRGFDQKRIGVMINGIPLNDPEDHGVYWVNMPDFAESASNIQFQRGVGSSIYGVSTFGGSLNMQTSDNSDKSYKEAFFNMGSYKSFKYGVKAKQNFGKLSAAIRLSRITSDGYRDNSGSELWSLFTALAYKSERSLTEINFFTGHELTHAAWEASGDWILEENHQDNPYTYDNTIDDFSQPHFEIHNSFRINEDMDIKNSVFYIHGNGFYESYKEGRDPWEYGIVEAPVDMEVDLIRQKWVTKNHYGLVSNFNWRHTSGDLSVGTYLSGFNSDHWGEVEELLGDSGLDYTSGQKYYNYIGEKQYATVYMNEIFKPIDNLSIMANLYFQNINYAFDQEAEGNFAGEFLNSYEVEYNFFNPRFGMNYNLTESMNIYVNYSQSHREPTDNELYDTWDGPDDLGIAPLFATADTLWNVDGTVERVNWSDPYVEEEKLQDYEFGFGYSAGMVDLDINGYLMNFVDEIVGYGGVNEDGGPIRGNADKTIHRGVEISTKVQLPMNLALSGNFSYSENYFDEFKMFDYDENWDTVEVDFSGNTIAGFPDIIAGGKLAYTTTKFNLFTQLQFVGEQYLDNTENDERTIDAFRVVNLGVNIDLGKIIGIDYKIDLNAKVNNLLDETYETAGYYDPWGGVDWSGANYFWPAAGRNFLAGIRVGF